MTGEQFKEMREKLGYSQEELAVLLGKTRVTISRWENSDKIHPNYVSLISNMYKSNDTILNQNDAINENVSEYENKNGNKFIELPNGKYRIQTSKVPFKAYSSFIEVFNDEYQLNQKFETTFFTVDQIGHGKYIAFVTQNESMNGGGINDTPGGAEVLCREVGKHNWNDGFRDSDYGFIIVAFNGIFHKDIQNTDEKGKIMCTSRNPSPEHQPFPLILDEVHSIWRVIKRTF